MTKASMCNLNLKMKIFVTVIVLSALGIAAACGTTNPANTTTNAVGNANATAAATPATVEMPSDDMAIGRSLYEQNCAACHKEDGTGGKMTIENKTINVDDLTSEKLKRFDDAKITRYIYEGVEDEGMPAFKDKLSEAQINEVVRYVRQEIQKIPATATASPAAKK